MSDGAGRGRDVPPGNDAPEPEALLTAFLEASTQGLLSYDAKGRVTAWNRAAERIFDRTGGEIDGQPFVALFPPRVQSDLQRLDEAARAGERFERVSFDVDRKDGMTIPISLSVLRVLDAHGGDAGCVAVVDELTEVRLAQAMLAEVEARSREWEALAHVGRWLWDVGTDSVQWSDELHRLHAVEPLAFEGTLDAHLACIHPGDRDRLRARMQEAVASGRSFDDVYRVVVASGDTITFDVRAEPTIGASGAVVGLRGVSRGRPQASPAGRQEADALEQV